MKKLCTYSGCKTIVEDGYRCALHPAKPVELNRKKVYPHHYHEGKNIYFTNRWKKVRSIILKEQPLCVQCEKLGLTTQATDVDHIVEIKDGGDPFNKELLQPLCRSCHNRKTAKEAKRRRSASSSNGFKSLSQY